MNAKTVSLPFGMRLCYRNPPLSRTELFTQLRVGIMSAGPYCFPCMDGINVSG